MVVAPIRAARARGRRRCPRAREGVRCGGLMQYEPLWSAPSGFQACDGIPFTPVPKLAQREIRGSLEIKLFFRSRTSAAKVPFCFGSERQRHRPRSLDADTAPRPHNGERHRHAPRARSPHGLSCSDPTRLCTRAHARRVAHCHHLYIRVWDLRTVQCGHWLVNWLVNFPWSLSISALTALDSVIEIE